MTQRERVRTEDKGTAAAGVYDTPATTRTTISNSDAVADAPKDLIRWGPVIGGLFAALASLIALSILGLAIGADTLDANNLSSAFGIGATIWGAVSALLAFLIGGWIAGKSAAFSGRTSGIMNGAMVWFLAIPLLVYLLVGGIGALTSTALGAAGTAVESGAAAVGGAAENPATQATAQAGAADAAGAVQATAQAAVDNVTPTDVNNVANSVADGAWRTLLSLGLTAAAAILGGWLGARRDDDVVTRRRVAA